MVLRDFALAMILGVLVGTYSSVFVASPVVFAWRKEAKRVDVKREKVVELAKPRNGAGRKESRTQEKEKDWEEVGGQGQGQNGRPACAHSRMRTQWHKYGGHEMNSTENQKPKPETQTPTPKAMVLYGYGLNCDYETAYALSQAGAEAVRVHTTDLLENPGILWDYHLLAVPGGFSWGDDHGAGVILALRLKLALGSALQEFIAAGRLVIGICNGFQVLVNLGLLPGLPGRSDARLAALIPNDCGNFRDAWVHLKAMPSKCVFTQGLDLLELAYPPR